MNRLLVLGLVFILGCASAEKKAAELMENGAFEEAAAAYEKIIFEDPKNAEAQAGLTSARTKAIDARLLNVRKTRMSGQRTVEALIDILGMEKRWGVQPAGAAAFTQKEEIDYATKSLLSELSKPELAAFPLRREIELRRVEALFQVSHKNEFAKLHNQVKNDGKAACIRFSSGLKSTQVYAVQFTKRFCGFWKTDSSAKFDEALFNRDLISDIQLTPDLTGFPSEARGEILASLMASLKETPWYSAKGKGKLQVKLAGTWAHDLQRNTTQLLHNYDVQEAYIENVSVMKTRQVPRSVTQYHFNASTGVNEPHTTTEYVSENYYESEPQTKYRTVQKTFPYGGWSLNQKIKIALDGSTTLYSKPLKFSLHEESVTQDTESDVANPGIGLSAKVAEKVPKPSVWLQEREKVLAKQLFDQASAVWSEQFCTAPSDSSFGASGDKVFRCLKLASAATQPPQFVHDWYQKNLGVSLAETESLLATK